MADLLLNLLYFVTIIKTTHQFSSLFLSSAASCWLYEEEINCEYALLRRQNMVRSSPSVYCNPPAYQLSVLFDPHTQPPPLPSLFCAWEYFTVKNLLRKNKHQWLNKLCNHFDVLLKKDCQRKFTLGNSTKIRENKSSRKIHREPLCKIKSKWKV